jgi:hypothetical protein
VNTQLDRVINDDNWVLLRRNGSYIEAWSGPTGTNDWVLRMQETDNTYTSDLWLLIGEGDNNNSSHVQEGWKGIGGGHGQNRTQIYRWIKN